jgi:hypothetical protein
MAEDKGYLPMTDDDVDVYRKKSSQLDAKFLDTIISNYMKSIKQIIVLGKRHLEKDRTRNIKSLAEIHRIHNISKILPADEIFFRGFLKIWMHRDHITEKDTEYFLKLDVSKMIKDDHKQDMIRTLINVVVHEHVNLDDATKEKFWIHCNELLHYVGLFLQEYSKLS